MLAPDEYNALVIDKEMSDEELTDCCDSVLAVLTADQLSTWISKFNDLVLDPDIDEYCEYGTLTQSFNIDNQILVIVSDSGGEYSTAEFIEFCLTKNIEYQTVVDSIDCTGIQVDEIYTGTVDNNLKLLTLLHKVYN